MEDGGRFGEFKKMKMLVRQGNFESIYFHIWSSATAHVFAGFCLEFKTCPCTEQNIHLHPPAGKLNDLIPEKFKNL
jgi:hypothetical protein